MLNSMVIGLSFKGELAQCLSKPTQVRQFWLLESLSSASSKGDNINWSTLVCITGLKN